MAESHTVTVSNSPPPAQTSGVWSAGGGGRRIVGPVVARCHGAPLDRPRHPADQVSAGER